MNVELFDSLSERKKKVLLHLEYELNSPLGNAEYIETEKGDFEVDSIDYVLMEPSEDFDYYYLSTVGLSRYQFDNSSRCEIGIILPNTFDRKFSKEEGIWPLQLLSAVAFASVDNAMPIALMRMYQVAEENKKEFGGNVGGVVVLPEYMNASFIEEKIEGTYTRFFVLVPVNSMELSKAQSIGIEKFVEYDLHDVDGPDFVADYDAPTVNTTLQKIIRHNERNLKK